MMRRPFPKQRRGVILILVLTMLALLALVGITFAVQRDAERPGNQQFQREINDLGADTRDLAFFLGRILTDDRDDEEGVYSGVSDDLGRLSARAAEIQVRVHRTYEESTDPRARADL